MLSPCRRRRWRKRSCARRDAKIAEEAFVYGLPLVMNDPGLYGTLKPWFNQTWKPDDIEPI